MSIPEGYMENGQGALIPMDKIKPVDKLRDEQVNHLTEEAKKIQHQMIMFKNHTMSAIAAFVDLSLRQYDVKIGGKKGNITLRSFDDKKKIQLAIHENIRFDERLQAAKELIDECIKEWSEDSNDNMKILVNDAFEVDKEGNISTGKVLRLRRYNITDKRWEKAMQAIADSITVTDAKEYIRFYERRDTDQKFEAISLDIAAL